MNEKSTLYDLLMFIPATSAALVCAITGLTSKTWGMAIVGIACTLIFLYAVYDMLKIGLRPATPFERFEWYSGLRAVGWLVGGGIGAYLFSQTPALAGLTLGVILYILVWIIGIIYLFWRIRGRHEAVGAYKRRVGYREEQE